MAYVVPIHRASSIRHALKLQFLKPEEESLVVALVLPLLLPGLRGHLLTGWVTCDVI